MSISNIKLALHTEMEAKPKYYIFKFLRATPHSRESLSMEVQSRPVNNGNTVATLDDSLCGATAWWAGSSKGGGQVKQVWASESRLLLSSLTGDLPHQNQDIRLYPANFIQPLIDCWNDDDWAKQAFASKADLASPRLISSAQLFGEPFKWLRPGQRKALALVSHSSSFLWGPPGTGKTTLLGVILSEYLYTNPNATILFLSTTNHAVDQATIAVDNSLKHASKWSFLRQTVRRFGQGYSIRAFKGREHLLDDLYRRRFHDANDGGLTEGETTGPENAQTDVVQSNVRLTSMTINRAISNMAKLRKLPTFDLVVFDEASQISLAHTLIAMPLGKARLFAGDPMQLPPVAQSTSMSVRRWLAKSAFEYKPVAGPAVCMLSEQSRMMTPICEIISEIFYKGCLHVATDALDDWCWLEKRVRKFASIPANEHVSIQKISTNAIRTSKHKGLTRHESMIRTVELIEAAVLLRYIEQKDVIVITPFRLQRALIRTALDEHGLSRVNVSTVHSAQGTEALVVIFDPVDAMDPFLMNQMGKQLINVALSRAQSKLILMLSSRDIENPLFTKMLEIVHRRANRAIKPIERVLADPKFITSAVGQRVMINSQVCDITRVSQCGSRMRVVIETSGFEASIDIGQLSTSSTNVTWTYLNN